MSDPQSTRPSLLLRVRDPQDMEAWQQFADLYGPLIHRFACRNGMQDADAADLTQDVLSSISRTIGNLNYDPEIGRFRSWLFTVARNRMTNQFKKQNRQARGSGDTLMNQMLDNHAASDSELSQIWDEEYEKRLFQWAADRVQQQFKEDTWQAFWQTAVDNRSPQDVANELQISVGAVYIAKSRVLARLKEQIERVGDR